MKGDKIKFKSGYKYQLTEEYSLPVHILLDMPIVTPFLELWQGHLTIKYGYAWDGPSGPAWDTKDFMRASLVHDALYQLLREGHLPSEYRNVADATLRTLCLEDGMPWWRAWWVYRAVRRCGAKFAQLEKAT